MSARVKQIVDAVRELPPSERRMVVEQVFALADEEDGEPTLSREQWAELWTTEVLRRKVEQAAGASKAFTLEEVRSELARRRQSPR